MQRRLYYVHLYDANVYTVYTRYNFTDIIVKYLPFVAAHFTTSQSETTKKRWRRKSTTQKSNSAVVKNNKSGN